MNEEVLIEHIMINDTRSYPKLRWPRALNNLG